MSETAVAEQSPPRTIRQVALAAVDRVMESGVIEQTIEESLAETIKSAIKSELREYSDFGKQIGKALRESLKVGDDLDLPSYGDVILKIVRKHVDAAICNQMQKQVEETLTGLLASPPETIKLSELVKAFIERHTEDGGCSCEPHAEKITFIYEQSSYNFRYIHLDPKPRKEKYQCQVQIGLDEKYKVFTVRLDKEGFEKKIFAGPLNSFDRLLFQLYTNHVPVVIDQDPYDIDTHYPNAID